MSTNTANISNSIQSNYATTTYHSNQLKVTSKKARIKYKIEFPPGAMGLELEPVIKSSEREIGCRVKDFYFSIDHSGVDQAYLEARVSVGDIITAINGDDIRSLPFVSIVERLKELKDTKRVITFKNITAAWTSKGSLIGAMDEPSLPLSPAPVMPGKKGFTFPRATSDVTANTVSTASNTTSNKNNVENESDPSYLRQLHSTKGMMSPSRDKRKALNQLLPQAFAKALPSTTPSVTTSTTTQKQQSSEVFSRNFVSNLSIAPPQNTVVVESVALPQSPPPPFTSDISQITLSPPRPATSTTATTQLPLPNHSFESLEKDKNDVAPPMRQLAGLTSEVLTDLMPVYSEREMQHTLAQKNHLLSELSRCMLLLGQTEERAKDIEAQLVRQEEFHSLYHDLQTRYELLQATHDTQSIRIQKYEAETSLLLREKEESDKLVTQLSDEVKACQRFNQEAMTQVTVCQERIATIEGERQTERAVYQESVAKMCEEQRKVKKEMTEAFDKADERINLLEQEKAQLTQTIASLELENNRYKESTQTLLVQKKEVLTQADDRVHALEQKLASVTRERDQALSQQRALQASYDDLNRQYQELRVTHLVMQQERGRHDEVVEEKDQQWRLLLQQKKTIELSLQEKAILLHDVEQRLSIVQDQQHLTELSLQIATKEVAEARAERDALALSIQQKEVSLSLLRRALSLAGRQHKELKVVLEKMKKQSENDVRAFQSSIRQSLEQVLTSHLQQIAALTQEVVESRRHAQLLESAAKEVQTTWLNQSLQSQETLTQREKEMSELRNSLTAVQSELSNCLSQLTDVRVSLKQREEEVLRLTEEKTKAEEEMSEQRREVLVESAKSIQRLHLENTSLHTSLQEKASEVSSLTLLLQQSRDEASRERREVVALRQQCEEQDKVMREYQLNASSMKDSLHGMKEQEGKLTERLGLLLHQLQEKEVVLAQLTAARDALTQQLHRLQTESSKNSLSLQEKELSLQQCRLEAEQWKTSRDVAVRETRSLQESLLKREQLLLVYQEELTTLQLPSLRAMLKGMKNDFLLLQQVHVSMIKSYREKVEVLEKKLLTSSSRPEREGRKDVIALLNREKEELLEKVLSLEQSLVIAEQRCLSLGETLVSRESDVDDQRRQLQQLLAEKEEEVLALRRREDDLTSQLKQREEVTSQGQQRQLQHDKEMLEEAMRLREEKVMWQREREEMKGQWEKHLLDKQQHYAAELANRDLLIQEMHVVSRENAQLVQDLEKRHEEVLRQYHRQCEEVQTQQRQLRDSVQHLLATASQHQLSEKQQLTRALQHYLSTTSQKWSEKEKEWRQRCQQLELALREEVQRRSEGVRLSEEITQLQRDKAALRHSLQQLEAEKEQVFALHLSALNDKEALSLQYEKVQRELVTCQQRLSDKEALSLQYEKVQRELVTCQQRLSDKEALSLQYEKVQRELVTCQQRLAEVDKDRQSKAAAVTSLRETIEALEHTLSVAANREVESKEVLQSLNERLLQREKDVYLIEKRFQQLSVEYQRVGKELSAKNDELDLFHNSLQHLILNTSSTPPLKPVETDVVITARKKEEEEYVERLFLASLSLHQTLTHVCFLSSQHQLIGEQCSTALVELSTLHGKLHDVIAHPPWHKSSSGQSSAKLELTPAHQLFAPSATSVTSSLVTTEEARKRKVEALTWQMLAKIFLHLYRNYKQRQSKTTSQHLLNTTSIHRSSHTHVTAVEKKMLADHTSQEVLEGGAGGGVSLESTDELIQRIDRFLVSVKRLDHSHSRVSEVEASDEVVRHSVSLTSTSEAVTASSDGRRNGELLDDVELSGDFWNISTDEEHSTSLLLGDHLLVTPVKDLD